MGKRLACLFRNLLIIFDVPGPLRRHADVDGSAGCHGCSSQGTFVACAASSPFRKSKFSPRSARIASSLNPRPRVRGTHFAERTFFCFRQTFVLHTNLFEMVVLLFKSVAFQVSFRRRFFGHRFSSVGQRLPGFAGQPKTSPSNFKQELETTGQSFSSSA